MSSPASQVYHNSIINRTLVSFLDKSSLAAFMVSQKEGDTFDCCVKELYKNVSYGVIHDMTRKNVSRPSVFRCPEQTGPAG